MMPRDAMILLGLVLFYWAGIYALYHLSIRMTIDFNALGFITWLGAAFFGAILGLTIGGI